MTAINVAVYSVAFISSFCVFVIAVRNRRRSNVASSLIVVMSGLQLWALSNLCRQAASDRLQVLGAGLILTAVPLTAVGYYLVSHYIVDENWSPSRGLRRAMVANVAIPAVLAATNPLHHLLVADFVIQTGWSLLVPGPLFWLLVLQAAAGWAWSSGIILRALPSVSPLHRPQIRSIFLGAIAPLLASFVTLANVAHDGGFDSRRTEWTSLAFIFTALIDYWAFRRQGLMRVVPVARALVMEQLPDAIFVLDVDDRVIDTNPKARALAAAFAPVPLPFLAPPAPGDHHLEVEGRTVEFEVRLSKLTSQQGGEIGRALVVRDNTEANRNRRELAQTNSRLRDQVLANERLRRELVEQTLRDSLTGLHNRRHLERTFKKHVQRAIESGEVFAVVIVDIDHFKSVNDLHGHAVGDELLVAIARFLSDRVRHDDTLARFGGEEFVAILTGCDGYDAYARVQGWIDEAHNVRVRAGNARVSRTISAGIAVYPSNGATRDDALAAADMALYEAKNTGRNRVRLAPAAHDEKSSRRYVPRHRAQ